LRSAAASRGLTAACRTLELGGRALVLESSADPKHLCASRVNGGVVHLAFRSVTTDPAALAQAVTDATSGFVELRLARALGDNAARCASWLEQAGAQFTRIEPDEGWKDRVLAPTGFHDSTSFVWKDLGADRLLDRLERRIEQAGGVLLRGARATALTMRDGDCVGVTTAERSFEAEAVVLADGGFHGNSEMLRRFVTPNPQSLKLRGPPSALGDGIRLAEEAGARLVGMEAFYAHLLSADSLTRDNLCPFPFLDLLAVAGMIVDDRGKRFVDEGRGPHAIANALARHRLGTATVVFDEAMWKGAGREFFCPPNPHLVEAAARCIAPTRCRRWRGSLGFPKRPSCATPKRAIVRLRKARSASCRPHERSAGMRRCRFSFRRTTPRPFAPRSRTRWAASRSTSTRT
jgi:fumarate reductase flavoprotein subunit